MPTPAVSSAEPAVIEPNRPANSALADLLHQVRLEKHVSEPYYLQLRRQIESLVRSGALPAGMGLPSERDLAELLGLSRATVKRSYDELRQTGVLASRGRRRGTVIQHASAAAPPMRQLKGFTEEMYELGRVPSTRVMERGVVNDRTVASMFHRPSGAEFLRVVRVRLADGVPISREVAWYDLELAPRLADWPGDDSAYIFLRERCGLHLAWADQSIEAVDSSPEETETFGFSAPGPCLLLKRLSYTAANQLVEYAQGAFRGDMYRYWVKLGEGGHDSVQGKSLLPG